MFASLKYSFELDYLTIPGIAESQSSIAIGQNKAPLAPRRLAIRDVKSKPTISLLTEAQS